MSNNAEIDPVIEGAIAQCKAFCMERAPDAELGLELTSILGRADKLHPTILVQWWQMLEVLIVTERDSEGHAWARAQFDAIWDTIATVGPDKSWLIVDNMMRANRTHRAESDVAKKRAADKARGKRESLDDRYKITELMLEHIRGRDKFGPAASPASFKMSPSGKKLLATIRNDGETISDSTFKRLMRAAKVQYEK